MIPLIKQGGTTRMPNSRGKIPMDKPIPMRNKDTPKIRMGRNQLSKTLTPNKTTPPIPMPSRATPKIRMGRNQLNRTPMPNKDIPKIQAFPLTTRLQEEPLEPRLAWMW